MESIPYGWSWTSGLSWFLDWGSLCLCSGGWNWTSFSSAVKCPVVSFGVSVGLAWLWAACVLMLGCVPVLLVLHWNLLALGWSLVSVSVWRLLGELLFINVPRVRSSLMLSSVGVKPPASGFQSFSYSSLKTSPSIQHR